jgi:hypothetical protein
MASFNTQNPPQNTTMLDFRSAIESLGAPAKNCRFAIQIMPAGLGPNGHFLNKLGYTGLLRDMVYLCEAVEFPGRGFEFVESRYYGPSQFLPYNSKYNNEFSVSIITRRDAYERQMFDDWLEVINPTNTFDFNYTDVYYSTIRVFQLSEVADTSARPPRNGKATYLWELQHAWPFQVNPQPVTWADNDVLRLNITFTYRYWSRPGRDAVPGGSAIPLNPAT